MERLLAYRVLLPLVSTTSRAWTSARRRAVASLIGDERVIREKGADRHANAGRQAGAAAEARATRWRLGFDASVWGSTLAPGIPVTPNIPRRLEKWGRVCLLADLYRADDRKTSVRPHLFLRLRMARSECLCS